MTNGNEPINATLTYNEDTMQPWGHSKGLTKREHFAALFMAANLSAFTDSWPLAETFAKKSVEYADALINELNK